MSPIEAIHLTSICKQHFEQEEQYDESSRDLASGMADMLSFTEIVSTHAQILPLKENIKSMLLLVEDASRFIINDQSGSKLGTCSSVVWRAYC